jgi:hypothetical protein
MRWLTKILSLEHWAVNQTEKEGKNGKRHSGRWDTQAT